MEKPQKPDLSSMTTAEAEAWRAGWRAAREAAQALCLGEARDETCIDRVSAYGAAVATTCARIIRAMEPAA